jgi:putative ABC transport system permease protein
MRDSLWNVLKFAKGAPAITAVAVITLALGIGASTAIFSVLYAVSLRPLPYNDPDQLLVLQRTEWLMQVPLVPGPDFLNWAKQSDIFSALGAAKPYTAKVSIAGQTERLSGYAVSPDLLRALEIQPAAGRLFAPGDDEPGRSHVAVLGPGFSNHGSWTGGVTVGKTLALDGEEFGVIGSVPPSFVFPVILAGNAKPDILVPIPAAQLRQPPAENSPFENAVMVIGRLKPGVTITQAQAEMTTIASRLAKQYPDSNAGVGIRVVSLQSQMAQAPGMLLAMLLIGVGFLLLIACANIAILILTQGSRRQHEIAVRQALGAAPAKIVSMLFKECLSLSLSGGAVGLLIAFWIKNALLSLNMVALLVPKTTPIELNWQVFAFALFVSIVSAVVFGLIPALQLSRVDLNQLLKEGGHAGGGGVRSVRLRNVIVVCEVTLAFALLIACGLMIRGIAGVIVATRSGINPQGMLTMKVTLPDSMHRSFAAQEGSYRNLIARIEASRLVQSSTLQDEGMSLHISSAEKPLTPLAFRSTPPARVSHVSPGYFRTLQVPLLRGRLFTRADYSPKPLVAIVSSSTAHTLWPNQNPLGKELTVTYPPKWYEVVGVVADGGLFSMVKTAPHVYLPKLSPQEMLLVRAAGNPKSSMGDIHKLVVHAVEGGQVSSAQMLEDLLARGTQPIRSIEAILGFMAMIALLLATVGVFAVTSYSVTQRTHEIGVRMTLGAQRRRVLFLIMRDGMRLSVYGVGIGLLLALALGRVLEYFLGRVPIGALSTYFGVAALLLAVTVVASYLPARRATRIDPIAALRGE